MWRWHQLLVGFVAFAGIGMAVAASYYTVPSPQQANASSTDNVMGWAWADPIGWISLNDANSGSGGGTYGVNVDLSSGAMNGFAWSDNAGWICFGSSCSHPNCTGTVPASQAPYNTMYAALSPAPYSAGGTIRNFHGWAKICNEGDDGWVSLNCNDVSPSTCASYPYRVPFDMSTYYFEDPTAGGSPANGTSFAWNGTKEGTGFGYIDFHLASVIIPSETTDALCGDGIDNDLDGTADCAFDSSCAAAPTCSEDQCGIGTADDCCSDGKDNEGDGVDDCSDPDCQGVASMCPAVLPPDLTEDQCPLGTADLCCSDGMDNEADGTDDCEDIDCQGVASMCTISWLKTQFGNVYAQKGIASIAAPASQFNASYCLSITDGSITGFASQSGCQSVSPSLSLPSASAGYQGSLGSIDIQGIENGRYGPVVQIADGSALPDALDGKVYLYTGGGTLVLPSKIFTNALASNGRGSGLLYVKEADLHISGDMSYALPSVQNYLRSLASFGVIVTADPDKGYGGNIVIDPKVQNVVGAYFAEKSIQTGASATPLTVYGLLASRALVFERTGGTSSTAAETIIFDGRAVANPPPGMQDIGKSLPSAKDAF